LRRRNLPKPKRAAGPADAKKFFMNKGSAPGHFPNKKRRILQKNKEMKKSSLFANFFWRKKRDSRFYGETIKYKSSGVKHALYS